MFYFIEIIKNIKHKHQAQHVDHDHVNHAQHVDHVQHDNHVQHGQNVNHGFPTDDIINCFNKSGDKVPFSVLKIFRLMLLFLLLLSGSISLCIDLSLQREFKKSYLSQYVYKMLHGWIMKYALKMVRAIKSVNGKRVLGMGKNMCEVVCVVGWVWGMVTKKIFRLGKCFESFVNTSIFSGSSRMSKASLVSKPSIISKLNLVC